MMFGRAVPVPRQVAFFADKGVSYRYSGRNHLGTGWPDWLTDYRVQAERLCLQSFNSVLLNYYADGDEYMGWHSDDEIELGPAPRIAMYSIGAAREFMFREKRGLKKSSQKHTLTVESGSWLIMDPPSQALWQHCLPKRKAIQSPRISLTFRLILGSFKR